MRTLTQPGPAPAERIESVATSGRALNFPLTPGRTLIEALTAPVFGSGFQGGAATFHGAVLSPFRYVMPGPPRNDTHVAWFSAPRSAPGSVIETANATLGWRDGAPFIHCHAIWTEPDGSRRGGHILPDETIVASAVPVRAWGVEASITADPDPETNFTLFHPSRHPRASGDPTGTNLPFIAARIRPNQEIGQALSAVCRRHGLTRATARGSVGSLISPRFTDGRSVPDFATEVLIHHADITPDTAAITLAVIDMNGQVHEGQLSPNANPVCITFELLLEPHPSLRVEDATPTKEGKDGQGSC